MKILAVVTCLILAVMMFAPAAVNAVDSYSPAVMPTIQYKYYSSETTLFTDLLAGQVESMQWPLTYSEYQSVLTNTNIVVEPLSESGEFELAFNNNRTDGVPTTMARGIPRDPMNFTDFRNAMNLLVDKQATITGPTLQGFATQSDTQVPTPLQQAYVNTRVSGTSYPWPFDPIRALTILWNGGWYSHTVYPTLKTLTDVFKGGGAGDELAANLTGSGTPLSPYIETEVGGVGQTVVYPSLPGGDNNGQPYYWEPGYAGDPGANADAAFAGRAISYLMGYVRSGDARRDLGNNFCAELYAIGCPFAKQLCATLSVLRPFVIDAQTYDFATLGYSMGSPPNWWYTELTPAGIYPGGPNSYLVDDSNTTNYAYAAFTDSTAAQFTIDEETCQYNLVMDSYLVPCYCPATYCAYSTKLYGQIDIIGQGTEANGAQWQNWITLDSRTNPPTTVLTLGLYNPPDMINPIFQDEPYDFQVSDEIFTYPIAANPYTIAVGSAITGNPVGGDEPWMAYAWNTTLIPDPYTGTPNAWTNVTLWLRNDITWQDGVGFTDLDINYTIYINAFYGDSWVNSAMIYASNVSKTGTPDAAYEAQPGNKNFAAPYFTQHPSPGDPSGLYCCSILVSSASWLNLYLPLYQVVPQHIYKNYVPVNTLAAENGASTDGLHGLWPGKNNATNPVTDPATTLVGTGPFTYRAGSMGSPPANSFNPGGGITLDSYQNFFMYIAPGAIAFQARWINTNPANQPSGCYYRIGLPDLLYFINTWKTSGTPPSTVPISGVPGDPGAWNPAADLAPPAGVINLVDFVTFCQAHWGWYYGNYTTALGQSLPTAWPATEPNPPYGY